MKDALFCPSAVQPRCFYNGAVAQHRKMIRIKTNFELRLVLTLGEK